MRVALDNGSVCRFFMSGFITHVIMLSLFVSVACLGGGRRAAAGRLNASGSALGADGDGDWPTLSLSLAGETRAGVMRGLAFLLEQQADNGSWQDDPTATALVMIALANGRELTGLPVERAVERGRQYLLAQAVDNGEADSPDTELGSVAATAKAMLASMRWAGRSDEGSVMAMRQFVLAAQAMDQAEIGYGGFPRSPGGDPELATSYWALEALIRSDHWDMRVRGIEQVEQIMTRRYQALWQFFSDCQPAPATWPDGQPPDEGATEAAPFFASPEDLADKAQVPEAELLMPTLIGMRALILMHSLAEDWRLPAAWAWLREHWTETSLRPAGESEIYAAVFHLALVLSDMQWHPAGAEPGDTLRQWRIFTARELLGRQDGTGGWQSPDEPPSLATAYAVLSLMSALDVPAR